jgi:hypothetical protein
MKNLISILTLIFILIACTKDPFLIPASEIPKWLKDRITYDENIIKSDPDTGLVVTAWIRYKYNNSSYFEYHNLYWSSGPEYYDSASNKILPGNEVLVGYNLKKCCKQFVWKGSGYSGE